MFKQRLRRNSRHSSLQNLCVFCFSFNIQDALNAFVATYGERSFDCERAAERLVRVLPITPLVR
ncbi:MAG: hypothetical protein D4R77_03400 [Planctomycetaceae bacterium]|nr:MAG: hypothetical protein D4R77_03400 [Planctomycetaceae bacterium]